MPVQRYRPDFRTYLRRTSTPVLRRLFNRANKEQEGNFIMRRVKVRTGLLSVIAVAAVMLPSIGAGQTAPAKTGQSENDTIIQHLNTAITWYKEIESANESSGQPSDAFFWKCPQPCQQGAVESNPRRQKPALLSMEKGGGGAWARMFRRKPPARSRTSPNPLPMKPLRLRKSRLKSRRSPARSPRPPGRNKRQPDFKARRLAGTTGF